ncbi:DNA primase [Spiroplasma syrphidicola EA-1]|uniref:DNA primase n=1 Tax=Spiroplasma syrphidicola EA-1 TaxID=1276229 RepID=R4U648_9MOLU|nr:DNA primase [Spiroplasma syrphidicola]AGM26078.1 DNA primase [Spiroplasma syrphidicola EA-1]
MLEVFRDYLKLSKRGRNYVAICPFHSDSHPSLSVSVEKQVWRCFVCNVGGTVEYFVAKIENLSINEAKQLIAVKYNLDQQQTITQAKLVPQTEKDKLYQLNNLTMLYFKNSLNTISGVTAKEYLLNRKYSEQTIDEFDLGYSNNDDLINFLLKKGYGQEELIKANLARLNYKDELCSVFKERVMIPIKNENNQVVGFSGRDLTNTSQIKYLNSAETDVFTKSNILFNLNKIPEFQKEITVVEGYMDVISLAQNGIPAVALMGTNLSRNQISILSKRFDKVNVFLDNDNPGRLASEKINNLLANAGITVNVIKNNSQYKDADEICQSKSFDLLKQLYKNEAEYELE